MYIYCIDVDGAMRYVHDHFSLSGEAARMTENLFSYVGENQVSNPRKLILDVLDGFGFKQSDLDAMADSGTVVFKDD